MKVKVRRRTIRVAHKASVKTDSKRHTPYKISVHIS